MSLRVVCVVSSLLVSQVSFGKVIYGDDHRVEVSEGNALQRKVSLSAATMIGRKLITKDPEKSGVVRIAQKTFKEWLAGMGSDSESKLLSPKVQKAVDEGLSFCPGERFTEQPNPGMCSGFLIAHDLIVTAGHCVTLENFCEEYRWVFGFQVDPVTKKAGLNINEQDVYSCKKVVSNALNTALGLDYAVIQLDRSVVNRTPLKIRSENSIEDLSGIFVVGSPSGLPLKIAGGASVRTNSHPFYFSANLDTFQGNSGSAVFNATTGVVEGILVRGENDFVPNRTLGCIEANKCKNDECRGEDVSRMTSIPEVGIKKVLDRAAVSGDVETLRKLLTLNVWVDFYENDGQSAFMKAINAKQVETAKFLLEKGADVNLGDNQKNTSLHILASRLTDKDAELLKVLKDAKANLEARNALGETPLHAAVKAGNYKAARILIAEGADKNALDNEGETILFKFARLGDAVSVVNFANMGIDLNLKNAKNETAGEISRRVLRSRKAL